MSSHGSSCAHHAHGQGETPALAYEIGRRVGVMVVRGRLLLALVHVVVVGVGPAIVRQQRQVDGHRVKATAAPDRFGQGRGQGLVEAALQFDALGQGSLQGVVDGLVRGGLEQGTAGVRDGAGRGRHVQQHAVQSGGGDVGTMVGEAQLAVQQPMAVALDSVASQRRLSSAHGFLRE